MDFGFQNLAGILSCLSDKGGGFPDEKIFLGWLILFLNVSLAFADGMIIPRLRPEEPPLPPWAVKYHHVLWLAHFVAKFCLTFFHSCSKIVIAK
ncbi:MAG: hypothetical protein ABIF11_03060 [Nitrospirota bacterium]